MVLLFLFTYFCAHKVFNLVLQVEAEHKEEEDSEEGSEQESGDESDDQGDKPRVCIQ